MKLNHKWLAGSITLLSVLCLTGAGVANSSNAMAKRRRTTTVHVHHRRAASLNSIINLHKEPIKLPNFSSRHSSHRRSHTSMSTPNSGVIVNKSTKNLPHNKILTPKEAAEYNAPSSSNISNKDIKSMINKGNIQEAAQALETGPDDQTSSKADNNLVQKHKSSHSTDNSNLGDLSNIGPDISDSYKGSKHITRAHYKKVNYYFKDNSVRYKFQMPSNLAKWLRNHPYGTGKMDRELTREFSKLTPNEKHAIRVKQWKARVRSNRLGFQADNEANKSVYNQTKKNYDAYNGEVAHELNKNGLLGYYLSPNDEGHKLLLHISGHYYEMRINKMSINYNDETGGTSHRASEVDSPELSYHIDKITPYKKGITIAKISSNPYKSSWELLDGRDGSGNSFNGTKDIKMYKYKNVLYTTDTGIAFHRISNSQAQNFIKRANRYPAS